MAKVQIGTVGYRRPDGSVYRWAPIHRDATPDDREAADADIARRAAKFFAEKFRAYIEGTDTLRVSKENTKGERGL